MDNSKTVTKSVQDSISPAQAVELLKEGNKRFTSGNTLSSVNIFSESNPKHLVINGILQRPTIARIYDLQGRMVRSQDLYSNIISQYMDVTHLSMGVYVVRLTTNQQAISKKIIIH